MTAPPEPAPGPGTAPGGPRRGPSPMGDDWAAHARWWQDEFTDGVDPEYTEQILPLVTAALGSGGRVLDVGCGEGQVARALAAAGCRVVGVDPVADQVTVARARDRAGDGPDHRRVDYARAVADGLPFADGSFDAVVASLVFEHIDDVDGAVAEVARVLNGAGRFLFLLNHPLLQTPGSGWIDDQIIEPPEQYWRIGPYLTEASTVEEVHKGVFVRFVHRPLSRYLNTLARAGLRLVHMDEPAPPPGFLALATPYRDAATIPRLLALHLEKGPPAPEVRSWSPDPARARASDSAPGRSTGV
ncbi:MAG: class I SAM-dependent methyltransferase [Acidimicrobiales bacterium]